MTILLRQLENYDYEGKHLEENYTFYINVQDIEPENPKTASKYYITICNALTLKHDDYCLGAFECENLDSALHIAFNYNNL